MTAIRSKKIKAKVAEIKARKASQRVMDQELANERERSARIRVSFARLKAKLAARVAKETFSSPRRDELTDREISEEIQRSLRSGHTVRLTGRTSGPVTGGGQGFTTTRNHHRLVKEERARIRAGTPIGMIRRRVPVYDDDWKAIEKIDRQRRARGELEKVIWVPHWDRTGHQLKAFAWSMALWERGGDAMSLNLSQSVVDAARRDARGFATHVRERLQRELHRAAIMTGCPVPDFFLVVEATELGKPHLHGGIVLPAEKRHRDTFRLALLRATHGRDPTAKRTGREVDLRSIATPAVWANYTAKWWRGSAWRLGGKVFAASSSLRAAGKAWYRRMRASEAVVGGHEPDDDDLLEGI